MATSGEGEEEGVETGQLTMTQLDWTQPTNQQIAGLLLVAFREVLLNLQTSERLL